MTQKRPRRRDRRSQNHHMDGKERPCKSECSERHQPRLTSV